VFAFHIKCLAVYLPCSYRSFHCTKLLALFLSLASSDHQQRSNLVCRPRLQSSYSS